MGGCQTRRFLGSAVRLLANGLFLILTGAMLSQASEPASPGRARRMTLPLVFEPSSSHQSYGARGNGYSINVQADVLTVQLAPSRSFRVRFLASKTATLRAVEPLP